MYIKGAFFQAYRISDTQSDISLTGRDSNLTPVPVPIYLPCALLSLLFLLLLLHLILILQLVLLILLRYSGTDVAS